MKILKKILGTLALVAFLIPSLASAAATSWDYNTGGSGILQPLQSQWAAPVKVHGLTATSTSYENTFPRLNFTSATGTSATSTNFFSTNVWGTNGVFGNLLPSSNDSGALGASSRAFSDLFLASGSLIDWNAGDITATHSANTLTFAGADSGFIFNSLARISGAFIPLDLVNTSNSVSVQGLIVEGDKASPLDSDEVYQSFKLSDDAGNQVEFGRITAAASDVNVGTNLDGSLQFSTMVAGTLAKKLRLDSTFLYPFSNDLLSLGAGTVSWSDLFLADGGLINWNNGNFTLTHSAGKLTASGDLVITGNSTTTNATTTNMFSTTASSTNLFVGTQLGVGSSTPQVAVSLGINKAIMTTAKIVATSTNMTLNFTEGNHQTVRTGTGATTIGFTGYQAGMTLLIELCNPGSTAGAVTFTGVLWPAGTPPTTTTTADKCDLIPLRVGNGTSTPIIYGGFNQAY